ncbi:hypothetical protein BASA81_015425 [Batrachochytrium salamandrivorans]|nr:hypothetical protein BASA81_015425 [Batrachochytrium salamandrivorans]
MDKILFAVGVAMLATANVYLIGSGWVAQFEQKPAITGLYIVDLLLNFFPELFTNPWGKLVMEVMNGFAGCVIASITFESVSTTKLGKGVSALFMPVAQFVAIGFATPVFYGLISGNVVQPPRPVGKLVSYTVLLTLLVTGALGQMLESSIQAGDLRILVVFLLLPVVTIFTAVLLNGGGGRDSIGAEEMSYQVCVLNGVVAHVRVLYMLATVSFTVGTINPPSVFLFVDLVGLMLGAYLWISQHTQLASSKSLATFVLLGPGAHFALLCLDRSHQNKLKPE